uniref:Uncharacterized protein n=1 Tax=Anguilla anguilla TaxID=7936 RepID=A0A0E9VU45_ANGAN
MMNQQSSFHPCNKFILLIFIECVGCFSSHTAYESINLYYDIN